MMNLRIFFLLFFFLITRFVLAQDVMVNARVFLEGPYFNDHMRIDLAENGLLPVGQPYDTQPWNYNGDETLVIWPVNDIVDWVLVDLLIPSQEISPAGFTLLARRAGLLLSNGSIIGTGGSLVFSSLPEIYPVMHLQIHHRNHLSVTAAFPLTVTSPGFYSYDFTTGPGQSVGGTSAQKQLTSGVWGMIAADGDASNQVDNRDKNDAWLAEQGATGYNNSDYNMDGQVDLSDIQDRWALNAGSGSRRMLGLLEVCSENGRYFCSGGQPVWLTGSHTWDNLQDIGPTPFYFSEYLDWMVGLGHNFMRMWAWETPQGTDWAKDPSLTINPLPYAKSGSQYDLSQLNQDYFERLRQRIQAADEKGIYVSIMLFQGFSAEHAPVAWQYHPFNAGNNINGIAAGQFEVHTNIHPEVVEAQRLYVREVIDIVNYYNLTNVLYEIGNEIPHSDESDQWHFDMIDYIHQYEMETYGVQRPVGMVFQYSNGSNQTLLDSPADWISPGPDDGFDCVDPDDAPISTGEKVIISDTDHFYYLQFSNFGHPHDVVWKSFTGGIQVIHMDNWGGGSNEPGRLHGGTGASTYNVIRNNMGYARQLASELNLLKLTPQPALSSTGYCLASDEELVVYFPELMATGTLNLFSFQGQFSVDWLDTETGVWQSGNAISGGNTVNLSSPFGEYAVLVLKKIN
ncbi:MAG: hypothetical protein KQI35_09790 [Bacteroidetes bacterium]|nr:hypothetical protein [Bacteroidota bacterium]